MYMHKVSHLQGGYVVGLDLRAIFMKRLTVTGEPH